MAIGRSNVRSGLPAIGQACSPTPHSGNLLDEIAASQGLSTPKFTLHDKALEISGKIHNFVSMLRSTCALHLRGRRPSEAEVERSRREAA